MDSEKIELASTFDLSMLKVKKRGKEFGMNRQMASTLVALTAAWCSAHAASAHGSAALDTLTGPTSDERVGQDIAIVDVTGIPSYDMRGSVNNYVMNVWIGPGNEVSGAGWDVVLQTVASESWRDDIAVWITNTANVTTTGFGLNPGSLDGPGGPTNYASAGIRKLESIGLPNVRALSDGLIRLEFFEIVDDAPGDVDGMWVSGHIQLQTTQPIPVPTGPMCGPILCFVAGIALRRHRSEVKYKMPTFCAMGIFLCRRTRGHSTGM